MEVMEQSLLIARGRGQWDQLPCAPATIWWTVPLKLRAKTNFCCFCQIFRHITQTVTNTVSRHQRFPPPRDGLCLGTRDLPLSWHLFPLCLFLLLPGCASPSQKPRPTCKSCSFLSSFQTVPFSGTWRFLTLPKGLTKHCFQRHQCLPRTSGK